MARFKQAAKKAPGRRAGKTASSPGDAERLTRSLSESAQQIWLAGVGAFGRAQAEGTKLFEGLVREGLNLEQTARRFAGGRADVVRDAVEAQVGQTRQRAADTWDRLEKVFEDRVQRALLKLGVPGRDDLAALTRRVEALTAELRRQNAGAPARGPRAPAKAAPRRPATAAKRASTPKKAAASAPAKSTRRRTPAKSTP